MIVPVQVPSVGESITEGVIAEWKVADGAVVAADQVLFELETDKITMSVVSPAAGRVKQLVPAGATVRIGQVAAEVDTEAVPALAAKTPPPAAPAINPPAGVGQVREKLASPPDFDGLSPAVRRLIEEHGLDPRLIPATGKGGRLTKEDVLKFLASAPAPSPKPKPAEGAPPAASEVTIARRVLEEVSPILEQLKQVAAEPSPSPAPSASPRQTRLPLSPLRARIAERLVLSQQTTATLTTFNEADMTNLLALRARFQDDFQKTYGVKLGIMSFFVKAAVEALRAVPEVNRMIEGDEMVQNHFYDIGVAVSTDRGLVVPVVRDCDRLSFGEIELRIAELSRRARERTLTLDELQGGVFTISNGGVFGSLLSTPILNPPQAAILGMHAVKPRPVAVGDRVEVRPMMYLALSYDHRIVDGRESVAFLKRVVECVEAPERMLFGL